MKKIISTFLLSLTLSACSMTPTGPAEDKWDEEEKEDRVKLSDFFKGKNSKAQNKENAELNARLEKLERQQSTGSTAPATYIPKQSSNDITAPPAYSSQPSTPSVDPAWQNSTSYAEWKRARENKSGDYQEFKEYQQWIEFQKAKNK